MQTFFAYFLACHPYIHFESFYFLEIEYNAYRFIDYPDWSRLNPTRYTNQPTAEMQSRSTPACRM